MTLTKTWEQVFLLRTLKGNDVFSTLFYDELHWSPFFHIDVTFDVIEDTLVIKCLHWSSPGIEFKI